MITAQATQETLQSSDILKKIGELPSKVQEILEIAKEHGLTKCLDSVTNAGCTLTLLSSGQPIPSLCLTIGSNKIYISPSADNNGISVQSFDCLMSNRLRVSLKGPDHTAVNYLSSVGKYFIGDDILLNPQLHSSLEIFFYRRSIGDEVSVVGDSFGHAVGLFKALKTNSLSCLSTPKQPLHS